MRFAIVVAAEAVVAEVAAAAVTVVAAVVVLLVVDESQGTIQSLVFAVFLKGVTDMRTYGRTQALIEMRGRI